LGFLNVRPILSALSRSWTGPLLVAAQIALTLAVLVNAIYIVRQRLEKIGRPTGIDVANIFVIRSTGITHNFAHEATIRADLAYLRGMPGVMAVTPIDFPPLSDRGNRPLVMLKANDQAHGIKTNYYEVDDQALAALGLRLIAGRPFRPDDILSPRSSAGPVTPVHDVIVTQSLAKMLYPDENPVGKTLYDTFGFLSSPATIIGIIDRMQGSRLSSDSADRVLLAPRLPYPDEPVAHYLVRTRPGQRDLIMGAVLRHLQESSSDRMIEWIRPLSYFKHRSYLADRNMEVFLVAVVVLLLGITSTGIYGLATFNVSTRTKQIGIRRALGAQRADIISYFLIENWLVTTMGVIAGCALALEAGFWLARHYGLPRLDLYYLVGGIPILWVLGQLAAWYPAWRASRLPPAIATRNV
jgi:putative ABC transport system permease protein